MSCGCEKAEVPAETESTRGSRYFSPPVDIVESEEALVVVADIPGARGEEIEVKFDGGTLTVSAPVKDREHTGKVLHREFEVGGYYRSFQVGEGIDSTKIEAQYQNGVLTLTLPKSAHTKARRIPVH